MSLREIILWDFLASLISGIETKNDICYVFIFDAMDIMG